MPTYDYRCTVCGHEMEVVHGVYGHGPDVCPKCGGEMRKAFVVPAIHFKGSGWAKKDRGAASSTKAARAGSGDGSPSKAGSDAATTEKASAAEATGSSGATAGPAETGT